MGKVYLFSSKCASSWSENCAFDVMSNLKIKDKVLRCYNESFEKGDIYLQDNMLLKQERS